MSKNIRKTGGEWTSFFFFRCIFIAFVGAFFRFLVLCSSSFVFETMRFRAKISNADLLHSLFYFISVCSINLFLSHFSSSQTETVQTIQKTSKTCVIQLGPESVLFLHSPGMSDGVQIWSNVKVVCLFNTFPFSFLSPLPNFLLTFSFFRELSSRLRSMQLRV